MESSTSKADDDGRGNSDVAEEVQHLDVGNEAVRRRHEVFERGGRHGTDDCDEEAEQHVLQTAQRNVEPARQAQIATEDAAANLPQKFRECADRAEPGAECLFEQKTLISMKPMKRNMAAGWICGTWPVSRKYFVFIRPAMGSQPSTPAGRETLKPVPPRSK